MIWPPRNKKDLLRFQIECAGQRFEWTPAEGKNFTLKPLSDFDAENFQKTARDHTKMYIGIPNFYPDLKKILENSVKLNTLAYYTKFDIAEKSAQIREDAKKDIQKNPFKVLMLDNISKKDNIKRKKLLNQSNQDIGKFVCYSCGEEEILFPFDARTCDFFAISPKRPHIIKTNLTSSKKLKNILEEDASTFTYLINLLGYFRKFYSNVQPPYTQKKWEEFLCKNRFDSAISTYWQNVVNPSIMMLVDTTRRFLNDALMAEHWSEIGSTKQMAQQKLKKDKDLVYRLSEKYGYIGKAEPFLKCEWIRNYLAHPSREEGLLPDAFTIAEVYQNFVFNFIDRNFLHRYYENHGISFPVADIQRQYADYETVRDADFFAKELGQLLPSELQSESNRKKIDFLNQNGLLTDQESQQMSQLFLQRNAVAHGQMDVQKISKSLFDAMAMHHALVHRQHLIHQ